MRRQTAEGRRTLLNPCHQFRIGTMSSTHRINTSFYHTFKVLDHLDFVRDVGTHTDIQTWLGWAGAGHGTSVTQFSSKKCAKAVCRLCRCVESIMMMVAARALSAG